MLLGRIYVQTCVGVPGCMYLCMGMPVFGNVSVYLDICRYAAACLRCFDMSVYVGMFGYV